MPEPFSQEKRTLKIATPLGKDALLLTSFQGREEMSRLFRYSLELLSEKSDLDAGKIVGKLVTFSVQLPNDEYRYFNGVVCRFAAGAIDSWETGHRRYRAEVVPALWFLTLNADCRIFQNKTIPDIIEQVLKDGGAGDCKKQLKGTYAKLEYCVQYRETNFDFVSRLMEEAGIYYYFVHKDKQHTLVLADHASATVDCDQSKVDYWGRDDFQMPATVTAWERQIELTTGNFVHTDYNFETPATKLLTKQKSLVKLKGAAKHEVFEYPGGYTKTADGATIATVRMQEREVGHEIVIGSSTCAGFFPGGKFKIGEHADKTEKNKGYALILVEHQASEPAMYLAGAKPDGADEEQFGEYQNQFQCIPSKVVFRPRRETQRPFISGPQTAVVVGAKGQEINTDKYGRVKVQFHWDRVGKMDEKSSCWIRVAQSWAGEKWGSLFTPRVGHEVVVEFLEGDPDRPIITGSIYNKNLMPPYQLPDKQTQSGLKTHSTEKGTDKTFSELRFDDNKGKEEIYFHAERDFNRVVENNDTLTVGFEAKDAGDQTIDIFNNRTVTIDKGSDTLLIKTGDGVIKIDKGDHSLQIKTGDRVTKIDKGDSLLTVKTGDVKIKISAGQSVTDAMKAIVLKVGSNSIKIDQMGITIKGMKVTVQGEVTADLKSPMTTVSGDGMMTIKGGLVKIN